MEDHTVQRIRQLEATRMMIEVAARTTLALARPYRARISAIADATKASTAIARIEVNRTRAGMYIFAGMKVHGRA